jgi:hypothetical protein
MLPPSLRRWGLPLGFCSLGVLALVGSSGAGAAPIEDGQAVLGRGGGERARPELAGSKPAAGPRPKEITPSLAAPSHCSARALILLKGRPLAGGRLVGSAGLPLVRAAGGDTPVLELRLAAPRPLAGPPVSAPAVAAPAVATASPAAESEAPAAEAQPTPTIRLLLDTGASTNLVTPQLVQRLGLASEAVAPGSLDLAGGGQDCAGLTPRRTRLPDLVLGPGNALQLTGAEALVLPVPALPEGVDGVLGAPSLRLLPIRIDPAAGRLTWGPAALMLPVPAGARRVALRWRHGVPLLTLGGGSGAVAALADTGAEGLFLAPPLASRLRPQGVTQPLRLVGFCGEQRVWRQRFGGLGQGAGPGAWGLHRQLTVEGIVTDNPIFRQLGIEAIVGQELLRHQGQLWRLDAPSPHLLLW